LAFTEDLQYPTNSGNEVGDAPAAEHQVFIAQVTLGRTVQYEKNETMTKPPKGYETWMHD
jgi:hypothetical protein